VYNVNKSRDSSVNKMTRVRFSSEAGIFFSSPTRPDRLLGPPIHPATYPVGTGALAGGKADGA